MIGIERGGRRAPPKQRKETRMSGRRRGSLLRCACALALVTGLLPVGTVAYAQAQKVPTPH